MTNYKQVRKFERKLLTLLCNMLTKEYLHKETIINLIRSTKNRENGYTYLTLRRDQKNMNLLDSMIKELKNIFSNNIICSLCIPPRNNTYHDRKKFISLQISLVKNYSIDDLNTYYKMKNSL